MSLVYNFVDTVAMLDEFGNRKVNDAVSPFDVFLSKGFVH